MKKRKKIITLIEVLAGIVIIAVSAMIALPAIQNAQETKRTALCQDTLRRWGQAFSMYADEDMEHKFPPIQMVNRKKMQENPESVECLELHFIPQPDVLYPSLIDDLGMLYCPSDPEVEDRIAEVAEKGSDGLFEEFKVQHFSYVYLGWAFDRLGGDPAQKLSEFPILSALLQEPFPVDVYVTPQFAGGFEALFSSLFEGQGKSLPGEYFLHLADSSLKVAAPLGNNEGETIRRLGKGVERFLVTDPNDTNAMKECASKIGTMMDAYGSMGSYIFYFNHIPGGSNVLYMDGHVDFVRWVGSPAGPEIDASAIVPVLPGMAPVVNYISDMGSGIDLRSLLHENSEGGEF